MASIAYTRERVVEKISDAKEKWAQKSAQGNPGERFWESMPTGIHMPEIWAG